MPACLLLMWAENRPWCQKGSRFKCNYTTYYDMFQWLRNIYKKTRSLCRWLRDGDPRQHPTTGRFVSGVREIGQTILLRTASGIYSFIYAILFQGLAIVAESIVGIFSDLWRSDRKHTRNVLRLIWSRISIILLKIIGGLRRLVSSAIG